MKRETNDRGLRTRPLYFLLVMGGLLAASAIAIVMLQNHSAKQYVTAIETGELSIDSGHAFTSAWRAVINNQAPPPYMDAEAAAIEADYSLQLFSEALSHYETELAEGHESSVRNEIVEFVNLQYQARDMLEQGLVDQALMLMLQANQIYYPLSDRVHEASAAYASSAERTRIATIVASLGVLAGVFVAGSVLYVRHRGLQQRAAQAAAEYDVVRRSEARFRPLVQSSSDAIIVIDPDYVVQYVSPAVERIWGIAPEYAVGKLAVNFVQPEERATLLSLYEEVSARPGYSQSIEVKLHYNVDVSKGVYPRSAYFEVVCTNCLEDPEVNGLVLNIRDISDRKELENQLRYQAFHDSLTGLANRLRFTDRLEQALERAKRNGGSPVGMIYMDLDYFKNVNDDLGHTAGDELLKQVAARLQASLRSADTPARLGGDEFAVLIEENLHADYARRAGERILEEMKRPFRLGSRDIHVGASIGVVVADPFTVTPEEFVRYADIAMYDAKENGRGRVQVFEPSMHLSLAERSALLNDLSGSIDRGELKVLYQPTLRLDTQRIAGFEALVRWQHPERGLLAPSAFIGLAEESGFIHDLGQFVLREACRQSAEWKQRYPSTGDFAISVNVSAHQVERPGFPDLVRAILDETGFEARDLILEITESVLIRHPNEVIKTLEELKQLGVQLALDDFGTGYSSLSYLKRFPIDIIKIDRAFIEGMNDSDRDRMLVQTVIDLGNTLKLDIVAEGIERSEQLNSLVQLHCSLGQGYLFAQALCPADAEAMLSDRSGCEVHSVRNRTAVDAVGNAA